MRERALPSLVALAGTVAAVAGVALLVLDRHDAFAVAATIAGFVLVAWVIFHPERVVQDRPNSG